MSDEAAKVAEEKAALRREILAVCKKIPEDERERAAEATLQVVRETPEFRAAKKIGLYAAIPDEIPSRPLFEAARLDGARCAFPRICGDSLRYVWVERWDELEFGRYGVLEPPDAEPVPATDLDLLVVPGVAFDATGARLGRGGGFYDRLIEALPERGAERPSVFGWAYASQVLAAVPQVDWDESVDAIVSETGIIRAG